MFCVFNLHTFAKTVSLAYITYKELVKLRRNLPDREDSAGRICYRVVLNNKVLHANYSLVFDLLCESFIGWKYGATVITTSSYAFPIEKVISENYNISIQSSEFLGFWDGIHRDLRISLLNYSIKKFKALFRNVSKVKVS